MTEKIAGHIERITFTNDDNGFSVVAVRVPGRKNLVVAVGHLGRPVVGEFIEMDGDFTDHPQFGPRFEVKGHQSGVPTGLAGLKKYLGSGLIKGVGPVLAERMVDRFGHEILNILDKSPERLTEVEGLGQGRREMIAAAWQAAANMKRLLNFLTQFGLGPALAVKVMKKLGPDAEIMIKEDPYLLAYEVEGIGFATADKVARAIGFAPDSLPRLKAGLLFSLAEASADGHVFLPRPELMAAAARLMPEAGAEGLNEALGNLILGGLVLPEPQAEPGEIDVYLPRLHRAEHWIAKAVKAHLAAPGRVNVPRQEAALEWAQKELNLSLAARQKQAALASFNEKIVVITGGPGTGKTTITKIITKVFGALNLKMALAAPTGRAAKRLAEASGLQAKTIHRLLEFAPQAGGFIRGPKNKLELDVLLLDEASMVDVYLMNQVMGALPPEATLILIGDQDQLPPVGPGRVLADFIESGAVATVVLDEIYRQAQDSGIIRAAHAINHGQPPQSCPDQDGDFYFIAEEDPVRLKDRLAQMVTRRLPEKLGLDPMNDIQVLTPVHQGDLGTEALNSLLADLLNPGPGATVSRFGRVIKVGDKILQLKNNYQREVFNGDFGRVLEIDAVAQELTADFEGRRVVYDFADLDELTQAYAITVHKSQGSEFPAVIVPVVKNHFVMLKRNLFYTAVTRGRRFVVLIGSPYALDLAVKTHEENRRHSRLAQRMMNF